MLRVVKPEDISQILAIENLTQAAPWSREIFEQCWQAGFLGWVVEQNQAILGFVMISFQAGETHILNICVHPDFQKQGHGQSMLKHVLVFAKSKGSGMVFLEVRRSNKNAILLYKKMDFIQIGERKNYYLTKDSKEDALIFAIDMNAFA